MRQHDRRAATTAEVREIDDTVVRREAARYGVNVLESEIVGLVPSAALVSAAEYYLQIERFGPHQVLENRLREH